MSQSDQSPKNIACERPAWYADADQVEITTLLSNLKQDLSLTGVISLGTDGVLRSLTWDRRVVDAVGLSPAQITSFLRRIPGELGDPKPFAGADGTKVSHEQWFNPDPGLLPPPLSEEKREKTMRRLEENPEKYRDRIAKLKKAWDRVE